MKINKQIIKSIVNTTKHYGNVVTLVVYNTLNKITIKYIIIKKQQNVL